MELTRKQAFELNAVLKNAKFDYPISNRFRYMSSYNIKATDAEIAATNEAFPTPEEWNKFVALQREVYAKHDIKTEADFNGKPDEEKQEIGKELEQVKTDNKDLVDAIDKYNFEKNEFMGESIDIELRKCKIDDIPIISKENVYDDREIFDVLSLIIDE